MTEIVIERTKLVEEILVKKTFLGDIVIWQNDYPILVHIKQVPALISALQQLNENTK